MRQSSRPKVVIWKRPKARLGASGKIEKAGIMRSISRCVGVALLLSLSVLPIGCGKDDGKGFGPDDDTYDIDKNGIPKFVRTDYIELSEIQKISRFRSAEGHSYSDDFEQCRSMKHYYCPLGGDPGPAHTPSWATIDIHSPVGGTISRVFEEWAGTQIQIKSAGYPAFYFIIFHVAVANTFTVGDVVAAGQLLGSHFGDQTMSDIAVGVSTPNGWKLISYFDVLTDSLFQSYQAAGVSSRDALIISREARDADPLTCSGETIIGSGSLENWIILN